MSTTTVTQTTTAPSTATLPLGKAITAGLRAAMTANDKVLMMGEDIGPLGGVFRVTEGLHAEFGDKRVLDTPLAESGIIGTAIGLAMRGYRPVCEIQFDGFIFPGFDQITTQLARMRNRHEGRLSMPVVIRVPYGGHIGSIEHHQESPEAYFAHTPGLRVVSPSNPNDAYWMIQQAIASDDPVLFFEPKSRYWPKGVVELGAAPEQVLPLHASRVVRQGTDVTVVGHGAMVSVLLEAAELAAEEGTSIEVIDLRSISPIDYGPDPRVRRQDDAPRRRAGGIRLRQRWLRDRGDRHGAGVLPARGPRAARLRIRHAVPARRRRDALPAERRPRARCRRPRARVLAAFGILFSAFSSAQAEYPLFICTEGTP